MPRSLSGDLEEGLTDGAYKKVVTDRGGVVEAATYAVRRDLDDRWHGIHEAPVKHLPDGRPVSTPNFVPTPAPHLDLGM
ncbi:hypothetical protein [Actinacidiphila sp. ITFR-21]|uniref:hypothetical protein n=1 Tax=Actinacidiphila sp. ITFR-21 TaxID=3075199 RepID=UPI002888FF47|nr:hypothetical protein [Streptomyces sp. ITFR-21]WNI17576.1 hypothetical protein RLT57_20010 [Streptomyces sp. ITFR-21]WNI17716.1 hypothetical protein RLT57_20725 [Streptomyces sp. ITFR-21]